MYVYMYVCTYLNGSTGDPTSLYLTLKAIPRSLLWDTQTECAMSMVSRFLCVCSLWMYLWWIIIYQWTARKTMKWRKELSWTPKRIIPPVFEKQFSSFATLIIFGYNAACNALECLLLHVDNLSNGFADKMLRTLRATGVVIFGYVISTNVCLCVCKSIYRGYLRIYVCMYEYYLCMYVLHK